MELTSSYPLIKSATRNVVKECEPGDRKTEILSLNRDQAHTARDIFPTISQNKFTCYRHSRALSRSKRVQI